MDVKGTFNSQELQVDQECVKRDHIPMVTPVVGGHQT